MHMYVMYRGCRLCDFSKMIMGDGLRMIGSNGALLALIHVNRACD